MVFEDVLLLVLHLCSRVPCMCAQLASHAAVYIERMQPILLGGVAVFMVTLLSLYGYGCAVASRVVVARLVTWLCSRLGNGCLGAGGGRYNQQCQAEGDSCAALHTCARSGCVTLKQHARVVCQSWKAANISKRALRRERAALRKMSAMRASLWRRTVSSRRRSGGLMLGQKMMTEAWNGSQCSKQENDGLVLEPPATSTSVLAEFPIERLSTLATAKYGYCLGDGNCLWRALSKALGAELGCRCQWRWLKRQVIRFALREQLASRADCRVLSRWATPGNAIALQMASAFVGLDICLDWQGSCYCFRAGKYLRGDSALWLRLHNFHFDAAVPVCGPVVQNTDAEVAELGTCYGGARLLCAAPLVSSVSQLASGKKQDKREECGAFGSHNSARMAWSRKKQRREGSPFSGAAPGRRGVQPTKENEREKEGRRKELKTGRTFPNLGRVRVRFLGQLQHEGLWSVGESACDQDQVCYLGDSRGGCVRARQLSCGQVQVCYFGGGHGGCAQASQLSKGQRSSWSAGDYGQADDQSKSQCSRWPTGDYGRAGDQSRGLCSQWSSGGYEQVCGPDKGHCKQWSMGDCGRVCYPCERSSTFAAGRTQNVPSEFFGSTGKCWSACFGGAKRARRYETTEQQAISAPQTFDASASCLYSGSSDEAGSTFAYSHELTDMKHRGGSSSGSCGGGSVGVVLASSSSSFCGSPCKGRNQSKPEGGQIDRAISPTLPWPDPGNVEEEVGVQSRKCVCGRKVSASGHRCAFVKCACLLCDWCVKTIQCDFGSMHFCPGCCASSIVTTVPLEVEPTMCDFEPAQQMPITLPLCVGGRWLWVRACQHESTTVVVLAVAKLLGLGSGTWRTQGARWEDNDVPEFFPAQSVRSHGMVWRARSVPGVGITDRVWIHLPDNTSLPLFVPQNLQWPQLRKRIATHLAVAPEWIEVSICDEQLQVQPTSAFPVCCRDGLVKLWECVDALKLGYMRKAGVGRVRALVAGLRATRAFGVTQATHNQSRKVREVNTCVRQMLPNACYLAFAVVVHRSVPIHQDLMDRKGEWSFTIAKRESSLWIEDVCGDHELVWSGRHVCGRIHDMSRRWCAFNPLRAHAVTSDGLVKTLVLYTPERVPTQEHRQQLLDVGFPVQTGGHRSGGCVFRDLWGGGKGKKRAKSVPQPRTDQSDDQPSSEYTQALILMRTCRTGLTDPQLKFILRGTQGLASKLLRNTEPARATQMVHAIAANLGMTVAKPTAGGGGGSAAQLGAKPKARAKSQPRQGSGGDDAKKDGKGGKGSSKGLSEAKEPPKVRLCDDEWSVPVGEDFTTKRDGVFLTQSLAQAKRWSEAAHNVTATIGVVLPFPMQLGYKEPTAVQFHLQNPEGQKTPAKGFLHHVTAKGVKCTSNSQVVELPSLRVRSMLVLIDVCQERVPDSTWASLLGSFENMKSTVPTLLPAGARSGLIEVVKTAEWTAKTTTLLVRMTEQAVQTSMKMLGEDGVTIRTPKELQSQFKIMWPDRGEANTLAVCAAWAKQYPDHAGVFIKSGRFALRIPHKQILEAKQACGQQAEERYVLRGLPLDADSSDVDNMLQAVGWAAQANPASRRVAQGSASFQVLAAHPPPKYGFYVKWGYLRCNVQVAPPRSMKKKAELEAKKEEKAPKTWAQVLRPAVFSEEERKTFQWVPPDSRKIKREQDWAEKSEGAHPENDGGSWNQVKSKRRKSEPLTFAMSVEDDDEDEGDADVNDDEGDHECGWEVREDDPREGWEGYDRPEEEEDMECEEGQYAEEADDVGTQGVQGPKHVDYAARHRIQIMHNQVEDLSDKMGEVMSLLKVLVKNQEA
eukprot:2629952-Amphidinium_carterae.1